MAACLSGHEEVVKYLLQLARKDELTLSAYDIVHWLRYTKQYSILKLLLNSNCSVQQLNIDISFHKHGFETVFSHLCLSYWLHNEKNNAICETLDALFYYVTKKENWFRPLVEKDLGKFIPLLDERCEMKEYDEWILRQYKETSRFQITVEIEPFLKMVREAQLRVVRDSFADFFAIVIFLSDDLLKLKEVKTEDQQKLVRFSNIARKLPLDIQMLLCRRVALRSGINIKAEEREIAFKALAKCKF
jgi:hypothetical protein